MAIDLIFRAFGLALSQLGDRRFRRVLALGVGLTLALLVATVAGFTWLIDYLTPEDVWLPILGEVRWVDDLLSWGGLFLLLFLSVFLMVPVASIITSLFLDDVADAVEAEYYPHLSPSPRASFGDGLRDTVNFLGLLIGANILALIASLVLAAMLIPAGPFIFLAVNGLLLGREYFTLAAMRRLGRRGARELRRRHAGTIWLAGMAMALPLAVPVVNLLIPIFGAATFTHLFHLLAPGPDASSVPRRRP